MQISSGSLLNSRLRKPPKSVQKRTSETLTVPSSLSQPRSCLSSVNRLLKAIEKSGLGKNPFPIAFQTAVSAIGGLFAGINILGELVEGDVVGALEDTANGAVSLHGGVKLVTNSVRLLKGLGAAGVILNGAFAIHDFSRHDIEGGMVHGATGIGLALSLSGALPAQVAGLVVLAVPTRAKARAAAFRGTYFSTCRPFSRHPISLSRISFRARSAVSRFGLLEGPRILGIPRPPWQWPTIPKR